MSSQLNLALTPKLSCKYENFYAHAGVKPVLDLVESLLSDPKVFRLVSIVGKPRFGKTHLAIGLQGLLIERQAYSVVFDGGDSKDVASIPKEVAAGGNRAIIVDNAAAWLQKITAANSGPFVDIYESARGKGVLLILLFGRELGGLNVDEHVMSRLNAGEVLEIGTPSREDLNRILQVLAQQRGILLSKTKLKFLETRLPNSISDLEAYMNQVLYFSTVLNRKITIQLLSSLV